MDQRRTRTVTLAPQCGGVYRGSLSHPPSHLRQPVSWRNRFRNLRTLPSVPWGSSTSILNSTLMRTSMPTAPLTQTSTLMQTFRPTAPQTSKQTVQIFTSLRRSPAQRCLFTVREVKGAEVLAQTPALSPRGLCWRVPTPSLAPLAPQCTRGGTPGTYRITTTCPRWNPQAPHPWSGLALHS
jgi:hypothetical protein